MNNSEKFYNRLAFLYPLIDFFLRRQKRKFFEQVNTYPHGRVLEIGVGNGSHFKYYNKHDIIGIDTSQSMLDMAARHKPLNIQLYHMSGEATEFANGTFDYVILSHVIAVVRDPDMLLREVDRVLKPNGKVFILNHFTPDNCLKYIDRAVQRVSRLFYLRSVFDLSSLRELRRFKLFYETNAGFFSYFKIMIYEKGI